MTGLTPKPDESKPPRRFRLPRAVALGGSACLAFAIFAMALTRALPQPHTKADYLIIGSLSTLAALITLFAGLVLGRRKKKASRIG